MKLLEKIIQGIQYLPKKDIVYAKKYINDRDFISLCDLVESAVIRIEKSLDSDSPKAEYKTPNVDLKKLYYLQYNIYEYIEPIIEKGNI